MMIRQMCTCGARFEGASVAAVWDLMDAHYRDVHATPSQRLASVDPNARKQERP